MDMIETAKNVASAYQRGLAAGRADSMAEIKRLREALEFVKNDCENCDWSCQQCFRDYGMKETDIYFFVTRALAPPEQADLKLINENR